MQLMCFLPLLPTAVPLDSERGALLRGFRFFSSLVGRVQYRRDKKSVGCPRDLPRRSFGLFAAGQAQARGVGSSARVFRGQVTAYHTFPCEATPTHADMVRVRVFVAANIGAERCTCVCFSIDTSCGR